ncbi:MAG TPA: hypothetical protein ENH82_00670 [bacterium]|nr:hypothetical protein [bacterium]
MAYKKETMESDCIKAILDNNLMFQEDIFSFVGFARSTYFDRSLDKSDAIKKALNDNRIKTKHTLKKKWEKSDNPTLQIALYKLICDDHEFNRLAGVKNDITSGGEPFDIEVFIVNGKNKTKKKD